MSEDLLTDKNRVLGESEERFRALVTAASDVVYRMSPDWSVMRLLEGGGFLTDRCPLFNRLFYNTAREKVQAKVPSACSTRCSSWNMPFVLIASAIARFTVFREAFFVIYQL
jgi:hypothetical protein